MKHSDDGAAGETESEQAASGIQSEGLCAFDADERSERAQLLGNLGRLALEFGGVGLASAAMTQDMRTMQADTGTQPWLRGEQFHDTRSSEILLGSK